MRSTRYFPVLLYGTFVIAAVSAAPLQAVIVVDQSQPTAVHSFPVDYWAQSFTPAQYNIVAIDLNFGGPGSYNIKIRDLSGGYNGPVIGSTGFVNVGSGLQHISFPSLIPLVPGSLYDISVSDSTPNFIGDYYVRGLGGANAYSNGIAHSPGSTVNGNFGHDWFFVTYAAVPEPSMIVFGAVGVLALIGFQCFRKHIPCPAFLES